MEPWPPTTPARIAGTLISEILPATHTRCNLTGWKHSLGIPMPPYSAQSTPISNDNDAPRDSLPSLCHVLPQSLGANDEQRAPESLPRAKVPAHECHATRHRVTADLHGRHRYLLRRRPPSRSSRLHTKLSRAATLNVHVTSAPAASVDTTNQRKHVCLDPTCPKPWLLNTKNRTLYVH